MTIGLIAAALILGTLWAAARSGLRQQRQDDQARQLDQSDPLVLAAVREVDAEFPACPILDPEVVRAEAREKMRAIRQQEAEREFFDRKQRVPIWNRDDVAGYDSNGMIMMKDGRQLHPETVALYGWTAALAMTKKGT